MARKKKPDEPPHGRPKRLGRPVQVYFSEKLWARVEAYLATARPKPSITALLATMAEDWLDNREGPR